MCEVMGMIGRMADSFQFAVGLGMKKCLKNRVVH